MDIRTDHFLPFSADLIVTRPRRDSGNSGRPLVDTDPLDEAEEAPLILCRNCRFPITRPTERIEVDSTHCHTFANPNGYLFEIGCFRRAQGRVGT
ncbi:MAG: hypothetical protein PVI90_17120, partial [Desulfobacteraceae bacterium]